MNTVEYPYKFPIQENAVLWQYDKSTLFCGLIDILNNYWRDLVIKFNKFMSYDLIDILSTSDIDEYSGINLEFYGYLIGIKRPVVKLPVVDDQGQKTYTGESINISDDLYRRILIAHINLYRSNGSIAEFEKYVYTIFENNVRVIDNGDMTLTYQVLGGLTEEEDSLINEPGSTRTYKNREVVFVYPVGVSEKQAAVSNIGYIGLNDTADVGQGMENFAVSSVAMSGGTFAT